MLNKKKHKVQRFHMVLRKDQIVMGQILKHSMGKVLQVRHLT